MIEDLVVEIAVQVKKSGTRCNCIRAINRGGIIAARLLSRELGIDAIWLMPVCNKTIIKSEMPILDNSERSIVIIDIYDTGETCNILKHALRGLNCDFFCVNKSTSHGRTGRVLDHKQCIIFPWE